jgi:hypothetical protein
MEASDQFHDPTALIPWKELPLIIRWEAGWTPESAWTPWIKRIVCCPWLESNLSPPAMAEEQVSLTVRHKPNSMACNVKWSEVQVKSIAVSKWKAHNWDAWESGHSAANILLLLLSRRKS